MTSPNGYIVTSILTDQQKDSIKSLFNHSLLTDGPSVYMKSSIFQQRKNIDNFLFYQDGILAGYLNLEIFQNYQAQIWGLVHPQYRRQGIFSNLLNAAWDQCKRVNIIRAILYCQKQLQPAAAFAKSFGARYFFSEYQMEFDTKTTLPPGQNSLSCKKAVTEEVPLCADILTRCFIIPRELAAARYYVDIQYGFRSLYIVRDKDKIIGKFDLANENPDLAITGFCILPEYRRQGLGREMLKLAISEAAKYNPARLCLEVDCNNNKALKLYQSLGFFIVGTLNYYQIFF